MNNMVHHSIFWCALTLPSILFYRYILCVSFKIWNKKGRHVLCEIVDCIKCNGGPSIDFLQKKKSFDYAECSREPYRMPGKGAWISALNCLHTATAFPWKSHVTAVNLVQQKNCFTSFFHTYTQHDRFRKYDLNKNRWYLKVKHSNSIWLMGGKPQTAPFSFLWESGWIASPALMLNPSIIVCFCVPHAYYKTFKRKTVYIYQTCLTVCTDRSY